MPSNPRAYADRRDFRFAVSIFNVIGPGGIDRKPARIELPGRNPARLWPYEFNESRYSNYAFWCW